MRTRASVGLPAHKPLPGHAERRRTPPGWHPGAGIPRPANRPTGQLPRVAGDQQKCGGLFFIQIVDKIRRSDHPHIRLGQLLRDGGIRQHFHIRQAAQHFVQPYAQSQRWSEDGHPDQSTASCFPCGRPPGSSGSGWRDGNALIAAEDHGIQADHFPVAFNKGPPELPGASCTSARRTASSLCRPRRLVTAKARHRSARCAGPGMPEGIDQLPGRGVEFENTAPT